MARYQEPESRAMVVVPGPYMLKVRAVEHGISTGAKTGGSTLYTIQFDILGIQSPSWMYDRLIDSERTVWRMNAFAKALGFHIPPGTDYEIHTDRTTGRCSVLSVVGLRCWANLVIEDYVTKNNVPGQKNVIGNYIVAPTPQQLAQLNDPEWGKRKLEEQEDDVPF